jgi:hypothetical protein
MRRAGDMINKEKNKAIKTANKQYKKLAAFIAKNPIAKGSTTIEVDAARRALPSGKRTAKSSGKTYYEYRENRMDRTRKRYPYLELGGRLKEGKSMLADGGKISASKAKSILKEYFDNEEENLHGKNAILLAKHFGTEKDLQEAKDIYKKHLSAGSITSELREKRDEIHNRLYPKLLAIKHSKYADGGETLKKKIVDQREGGLVKTIKESDIQVGRKFNLVNGESIEIIRLFKENIDEDWAEYTFRGEKSEGSVKRLKNFINSWRGEEPHEFKKGGRVNKDWTGRKSKESWGKEDLSEQYDLSIDLIADVHDYYKKIAEEHGKEYADNLKDQMIEVLKTGHIRYRDGSLIKFAKGGETNKTAVDIGGFKINIMGTLSFNLKLPNMRKAQDFTVYPASEKSEIIMIQSDTRIGKVNMSDGKLYMSKSHINGAYAIHLSTDTLDTFTLTAEQLETLKSELAKTAGSKVGKSVVYSDNSYADKFAKGGETKKKGFPIGSSVMVHFRNEAGIVKSNKGNFITVEYPQLGFSEGIDLTIEKVTLQTKSFADGGELKNSFIDAQLKHKLLVAKNNNIDRAMEFIDMRAPIRPMQLIKRAVTGGYIDLSDVNAETFDAAEQTVSEIGDVEEVGSSDFTFVLKRFLGDMGYKTDFVNNRLTVTGKYADGGLISLKGSAPVRNYPKIEPEANVID